MGDTATILHLTLALCAFGWLVGCAEDPLPPSVEAFMEDPILLDATMVRCVANRNAINTEPECVNAREAVERLAAAEEKARRAELEAESARKREALRRSREVVDEARRLAEEAERRRREAELLGFDPADPAYAELEAVDVPGGNAPAARTEEASQSTETERPAGAEVTPGTGTEHLAGGEMMPETAMEHLAGGEAMPNPAVEAPSATTDLGEVREQLEERRQVPPETTD